MDKKLIFNGLEANCFHNHFTLTIEGNLNYFSLINTASFFIF
jgi:hypothetical protein